MNSNYHTPLGGVQPTWPRAASAGWALVGIAAGVVVTGAAVLLAAVVSGADPGTVFPPAMLGMATAGGAPSRGRRSQHTKVGALSQTGPGSAALGRRPRAMSPSHLARPAQRERWIEEVREVLRREIRRAALEANPELTPRDVVVDEAEVQAEALAFVRRQLGLLAEQLGTSIDLERLYAEGNARYTRRALRELAAAAKGSAGSVEPYPKDTRDAIEAHAIRSTPAHRRLMAWLTRPQPGGSDYSLARAVLEAMWFTRGNLEMRPQWQEFTQMNLIKGWAYGMPCAFAPDEGPRARSARSEDGVRQALFGRLRWRLLPNGERQLRDRPQYGLLDRHDPDEILKVNAEYIAQLRLVDPDGMREFGRATAVDSFRLRANGVQLQSFSSRHEELLNRHLNCALGSHGDTHWRGWMFMTLVDVPTGLPIVWRLIKASDNEADHLRQLLMTAHEYFPDLTIGTVSADMAFDSEETYRLTEREFGVHLIAELSKSFSADKRDHGDTGGCPVHDCGAPYALKQSTFHDSTRRRCLPLTKRTFDRHVGERRPGGLWFEEHAGELVVHVREDEHRYPLTRAYGQRNNEILQVRLAPGQDVTHLIDLGLVEREHLRWAPTCRCPGVKEIRTVADRDWRLHTWAPRRDVHAEGRPDRYKLRRSLIARHKGVIEGYHGMMRLRGLGTDGADAPRTPNTDDAVKWLHFGRALRITARRLVRLDGTYARSERLANDLGLLRPPNSRDLLRHAEAERDIPPEPWPLEVPDGV